MVPMPRLRRELVRKAERGAAFRVSGKRSQIMQCVARQRAVATLLEQADPMHDSPSIAQQN